MFELLFSLPECDKTLNYSNKKPHQPDEAFPYWFAS